MAGVLLSFWWGPRGDTYWAWAIVAYFIGFVGNVVDGFVAWAFNQTESPSDHMLRPSGEGKRAPQDLMFGVCLPVVVGVASAFGGVLDMVTDR